MYGCTLTAKMEVWVDETADRVLKSRKIWHCLFSAEQKQDNEKKTRNQDFFPEGQAAHTRSSLSRQGRAEADHEVLLTSS